MFKRGTAAVLEFRCGLDDFLSDHNQFNADITEFGVYRFECSPEAETLASTVAEAE